MGRAFFCSDAAGFIRFPQPGHSLGDGYREHEPAHGGVRLTEKGGPRVRPSSATLAFPGDEWVHRSVYRGIRVPKGLRACLISLSAADGPGIFRPARKKAQEYWMYSEHF